MKNKILLSILTLLLCGLPCFANAGIPLWIFSNSGAVLASGFRWHEYLIFTLISLFLLLCVSILEAIVINLILKIRNFLKAFFITLKANFISTIIGAIITYILFMSETITSLLWWNNKWFILNTLLLHIGMLILSFFIEYKAAKKDLYDFKINDIRKSFLCANILSYIVFPFLIIGIIIAADYISMNMNNRYEKINYKGLDNVVVTKSAFIPEPVSKKECKKLKKELGITAKCDTEPDYWTGAVKACGGIEHLYSQNQFEEIIKKVYDKNHHDYFFNAEIAKSYGLPADFIPPEIIKKHNFSTQEYDEYIKKYPLPVWIWTNKAFETSAPYVGKLYLRAGDFHSERYNIDKFSKTYAICINNKTIEN